MYVRFDLNSYCICISQVVELVANSLGSDVAAGDKELKTYIASMQLRGPSEKLADAPPCAKYRDLITLDADGLIDTFEVVMRPYKTVGALRDAMSARVMTDARFLKFKDALV